MSDDSHGGEGVSFQADGEGRHLSLPKSVMAAGSIQKWNKRNPVAEKQFAMVAQMCKAKTVEEAMVELNVIMKLGHKIWAYAYMRRLYNQDMHLFYGVLLKAPEILMPVVYTPTVGEACQKFGMMPFTSRGCYVTITDRGNISKVLKDYAKVHLERGSDGKYLCDCIVFSDGGRILGLGDLGAWGMGIPIGKLDLYTVCGGVNPHRTMPVIIDAGIHDSTGNTAHLDIINNPNYTGLAYDRKTEVSEAGTRVNTAYYGSGNMIDEFMEAAVEVFGEKILLQFEDFNSNDAFPLLARQRGKFLSYNDDIQGTAAVCVAGILGAIKIKYPQQEDLISLLSKETILLHGAGSANLGAASLLQIEGKVPSSQINLTNSRGLIWKNDEGQGTFRNNEQKEFAHHGEPTFPHKALLDIVKNIKPTCLVGAVGVAPDCFTEDVMKEMVKISAENQTVPVVFALSNPLSQAEITSENAYKWTDGKVVYGSGTKMPPVTVGDRELHSGQVNNVFIFPGMSFAAVQCQATGITDRLFLVAAEAVANSISEEELAQNRCMPTVGRIREVSLNVATAVVWECQNSKLARRTVGKDKASIKAALQAEMWAPEAR